MGRVIYVTGGCRSGKSSFALKEAEKLAGPRIYLATCPRDMDLEMNARINRHIDERSEEWKTIEETLDIASVIKKNREAGVVLVDCLTLWVSNLMYDADQAGRGLDENGVSEHCANILAECGKTPATVIFISNETGMGVVPENDIARRFRDLIGRCNQIIASASSEAHLLISGIPLKLK